MSESMKAARSKQALIILIGKLTRLWRLERGFPFKQQRRTSCTGEVVFSILGFDRPLKSMYE